MSFSTSSGSDLAFSDTFIALKFFGTPNDYDVVAAVLLPDTVGADGDHLRIRCVRSGRTAGGMADDTSPWPGVFAQILPPGFRVVQAKLTDFSSFRRDAEGNLHTPDDLFLEVVDAFDRPIAEGLDFAWYHRCSLPIPDRDNIVRVAGDVGADGFLLGGATWHHRLERLIRRYLGTEAEELRILDWGVGCARIARHFLERGHKNLFGADVDRVNIDWLHRQLDWSNAIRVGLDPPMPYPQGFFDVVYAHSVFTHLGRADHLRWISEIRRVLRRGGMAFLTISAEPGLCITRQHDYTRALGALMRDGFADVEDQSDIGVAEGRSGYYRLVFQTRRFILDTWGELFTVRRILPCYFEHQDLVIVQAR